MAREEKGLKKRIASLKKKKKKKKEPCKCGYVERRKGKANCKTNQKLTLAKKR